MKTMVEKKAEGRKWDGTKRRVMTKRPLPFQISADSVVEQESEIDMTRKRICWHAQSVGTAVSVCHWSPRLSTSTVSLERVNGPCWPFSALTLHAVATLAIKVFILVGHPSCLQYSKELTQRVSKEPWQCIECKICTKCQDQGDPVSASLLCLVALFDRANVRRCFCIARKELLFMSYRKPLLSIAYQFWMLTLQKRIHYQYDKSTAWWKL